MVTWMALVSDQQIQELERDASKYQQRMNKRRKKNSKYTQNICLIRYKYQQWTCIVGSIGGDYSARLIQWNIMKEILVMDTKFGQASYLQYNLTRYVTFLIITYGTLLLASPTAFPIFSFISCFRHLPDP